MSLLDKKLSRTKTSRAVVSKPHTKRSSAVVPKSLTWDLLRKCRHDLKNSSGCAMCKLVQRSTDIYLEQERQQNLAIKTEGFMKRAEMRLSLLDMWWRNQMYMFYASLPFITAEVTLCAGVAEALENCSLEDMHDLEKFLMKRARILEVGYYAAVTIQRFIRGYISRNKTIEYLLLRFEYIHPTKRTQEHYIDRETNDIWDWPPLLIDHCRPASPRTLQRRLASTAKVKNQRVRQYELTSTTSSSTIWQTEEQKAIYARQLVILRDVLLSVMRCISSKRKEKGERPPITNGSSRASFFPVWFTVSNPAPCSRQLYLSLLIETPPLEPESDVVTVDEIDEKEDFSLNDRCKILENRLFEIMKCESPEDILAKLKCEELSPALSSVSQIADDEYHIWNGQYASNSSATNSYDSEEKPPVESPDADPKVGDMSLHHIPSKSLLPIQLQLHPYYNERSASGLFRLVFVNKQLFLVTQVSTWAFYSEVWKLRNGIVKAIQGYADDPATKQLLDHIEQQASTPVTSEQPPNETPLESAVNTARSVTTQPNATSVNTARSVTTQPNATPVNTARSINNASTPAISPMPSRQPSQGTTPRPPSNCIAVVVPDANDIYGLPTTISTPATTECSNLSPSEFSKAESRYEFVKKMAIWKAHKKAARRNKQHIKSLVVTEDALDKEPKIAAMPPNEHLLELPSGQPRLLQCPEPLHCDLIVIEVHITFPTKENKDNTAPKKTKSLPPIDGAASNTKWKVDLHQIVGSFSSELERSPAGLDLGHFTWDKMKDLLADKRRTEAAIDDTPALSTTAPTLQKQPSLTETSTWVSIGNQTGVSKLKTMSYSSVIHFRMLSKPPTREYIEKNVPRKVRMWLGMKY